MKKLNKKLIVLIIIFIVLLSITIFLFIDSQKSSIEFEKDVVVEINSKVNNTDYLKDFKNLELISSKEEVDTSKLGKVTVTLKFKDKFNKEVEYSYEIEVKDTKGPEIDAKDKITTFKGKKVDLLDGVKATDNSNEDIEVKVEGEYDFNKSGEYELWYVAKDSSGNETKEKFILVVEDNNNNSNNNNNNQNNNNSNNEKKVEDSTFKTSKGFDGVTKNGMTYINGILIVNKTYSIPSTYNPGLNKDALSHFNEMIAEAKKAGYSIKLQSGFRSYSLQTSLYNGYVKNRGKEAADTFSARPGHSEHQSGLAIDVCNNNSNVCINSGFDTTDDAKWLSDNCYKYGFILRYPKGKTNETGYKYESWHFRYLGDVEFATKLYNNGNWITLEDYFGITSVYSN